MNFDQPPVVRVFAEDDHPDDWSVKVPAVRQLLDEGLNVTPGITFLVGENGAGKSTLVEAVAMAYGLSPEGGSAQGRHSTRESESTLWRHLTLQRGVGAARWGFFLRAETMHGWYSFVEQHASKRDPNFHSMSHGESFLAVLGSRFDSPGFYCLDEPEAALSFSSTLALMSTLLDIEAEGGQVLCATHSPALAALPGARILEVGDWGWRETSWDQLELVAHWRAFLDRPDRYLRHLAD